ncbi:MAG: pyridoxal phosphate-dependent aminotransferase [Deltaproteobacteria bacterium]|nr:pyridoxal phosphate-dependent aminotransferase [Deltaproteobacteria bacterium]MBI2209110.1 pyridoxal phosphate-dependent aminotransferase [Deltaproteobacteria bacterium]MBI2349237.1 pyridoxal phosphate-dependent aminotransferase [Deltaproteobacteria bacterium]
MKLSDRTKLIKPSVTLALAAKAQVMRAEGIDLVNFTAGEPDFDTPQRIKDAAVEALKKGMTKYTDVRGIEPLRLAILEKYRKEYGLKYEKTEVLVSCGGKHALYNVIQAVIDQGDEVVIPAPYWVSYSDMVLLAGGTPRLVRTSEESGYKITPEQLKGALTSKTRAFILNSPCNPTGAAYGRDELAALARVLERHDCLILSDDIYEKIVYDGFRFHSMLAIEPKLRERAIIFNSLSKSYAMTGWRVGYALGPAAMISAAANIQSQSTSNATSIAQAAALEALSGPQDEIAVMVAEFHRRRDVIVRRLKAMPGISCFNPQGAFYVFPNVRSLLGKTARGKKLASASDVVDYFLTEARALAVPGEDFGSTENIRISYATSIEEIEKGCDRIEAAIKKLE